MKKGNISNNNSVTLDNWLLDYRNQEELRSLFLNIDRTLKYIHEHGYCISVFYPTEIEILDNKLDHIKFNKLMELSSDYSRRRKMIQEDIYHSALIQIGIYSNSLKYLNPDFVKDNFDSFSQFIPSGDISYYRGVIQRGASVYFCEFAMEKRKRDLKELEKQISGDGNSLPINQIDTDNRVLTNEKVNDVIYGQINGLKDSAFIHTLVIPTIILAILFLFGIIGLILSFFTV